MAPQLLFPSACPPGAAILPRPLLPRASHACHRNGTPDAPDLSISVARQGQNDTQRRGHARVRSGIRLQKVVRDADGQERADE
jgi:hypothetical protein